MFNDILTNPIYSIISFVLTVVSFVLAFVFYYRSQSVKIPCYNKRSQIVINSDKTYFHPIKVSFRDETINNLTVTYVVVWNNGRATITKDDIAQSDPLRIIAKPNTRILSVKVASDSRKANNLTVKFIKEENMALVTFDFLDYKHGAIIQVYHTENGDIEKTIRIDDGIQVLGSIKGASKVVDTDRIIDIMFGVMIRMNNKISETSFRIVPKWFETIMENVESRQNFFLQMILLMLLSIPLFPFMILYVASIMIIFFPTLIIAPIIMYRYTIPKELYQLYSFATLPD